MSSSQVDKNLFSCVDLPPGAECALMPLCEAGAGKKVKVASLCGGRGLCARIAALGIYPGVEMQMLRGGCVRVNGGVLSLSKDISERIIVTSSS
jgi:ferrous iron transport protein A